MNGIDVLRDGIGRIQDTVHAAADGLDAEQLNHRPGDGANSIAWLIWHLTRVQDDHVAEVAGREQVWTAAGWAKRFALDLDPTETGYGHGGAEVAAVRVDDPALLLGYYDEVHADPAVPGRPGRRRPGPGRGRAVGPAGHVGRPAGQRDRRRRSARRAGRLPAGVAGAALTYRRASIPSQRPSRSAIAR